jgi:diguanylate cyclase (GGDEF)-like protein
MDIFNKKNGENLYNLELRYLQSTTQYLSPILDQLEHLAKSLGEEKVQISLYDTNGTLLLHYRSTNNLNITMSAYLPNLNPNNLIVLRERKMVTWSNTSISLLQEEYIQKANSFNKIKTLPIGKNLLLHKIIKKDDFQNRGFTIFEDNLAINYQVPLVNGQTYSMYFDKHNQESKIKEKYRGMIDLTLQFDAGEIFKIASITDTHINLFINNIFSIGTLYTKNNHTRNDFEPLDLQQFLGLDTIQKPFKRTIEDKDYYENQFSIKTDSNTSVMLLIMESREAEYQAIDNFLKKTSFIIFIFIVIVFIFTLVFNKQLVLPIIRMSAIINKLAKGDLNIEETKESSSPFNEIQKMGQALEKLIKVEGEISSLANEVANGDFTQEITPRSSKDTLIKSLNSMVKQLSEQNDKISETNKMLEKLSITDGLTGLNNRRYFNEKLKYYFSIAKRNSICINIFMLDIDYFKKYNDHFGHQEGDRCLQLVAQAIESCAQREDDFVARYGGEEFIVISVGLSKNNSIALGEKICKKVESLHIEHPLSEHQHVTVSIGLCSTIPSEDDLAEDLLKEADDALYDAKKNGRNRIEYKI